MAKNIIILGAGQVGGTLVETLVKEGNNITVVDISADRLRELQNRLDIRTIVGPASQPYIIEQAGGKNADMIIAVTSNDETNMIGCQVAYTLFQIPTKIARIRSNSYLSHPELFQSEALPIDVCIYPEHLITHHVKHLIEYPGTLQVFDFANHKIHLVAVAAVGGGPLVGKTLATLRRYIPDIELCVSAIYRENQSVPLTAETEIQVDDEVFFITAEENTQDVLSALGREESPYRRIIIGGGGHIGLRLAQELEEQYQVKIIEQNAGSAEHAAEILNNATVLQGDVCDRDLLIDENIESTDVFCAVTNDDEANVMSCIQAKRLGVRRVMALITRTAYVDLVAGSDIDTVISPQQITIGSILTHLRKGDVVNVHALHRGAAEAIELIAHGDQQTSKVIGRSLSDIKFPAGVTVGALARGNKILIAKDELVIEPEDHVILFLVDKKRVSEVERLFRETETSV